jgi:hypothetical protein
MTGYIFCSQMLNEHPSRDIMEVNIKTFLGSHNCNTENYFDLFSSCYILG